MKTSHLVNFHACHRCNVWVSLKCFNYILGNTVDPDLIVVHNLKHKKCNESVTQFLMSEVFFIRVAMCSLAIVGYLGHKISLTF